jgi:beta-lactamase regulating signal transducer with metallopeptidase domain
MLLSFVVTFALRGACRRYDVAADASVIRADDAPSSSAFAAPRFNGRQRPRGPRLVRARLARVVCLLALRVACGLLLLEHLRRRGLSALPVEIVERCLALQRRLGISRVVRYCECRLITVPSVIGFLRPIVLLPMRALTGLSAEQLEAVIAHELGHIKRFDVAVNLFQVVAETLFFFHPAVWWLNKRIRAYREECCDDVAISSCGRR